MKTARPSRHIIVLTSGAVQHVAVSYRCVCALKWYFPDVTWHTCYN